MTDESYPFVGVSQAESCRVELEKILPRGSNQFAEYFKIIGADPDRVLELAEASDLVEPRVIARYEDGGLFEFIVTGFCPAQDLIALGAVPAITLLSDPFGFSPVVFFSIGIGGGKIERHVCVFAFMTGCRSESGVDGFVG